MKCRYCAFECGNVDRMKAHLRVTHPVEYAEIYEYLGLVYEEAEGKERANKRLWNGHQGTPETFWDVRGCRI